MQYLKEGDGRWPIYAGPDDGLILGMLFCWFCWSWTSGLGGDRRKQGWFLCRFWNWSGRCGCSWWYLWGCFGRWGWLTCPADRLTDCFGVACCLCGCFICPSRTPVRVRWRSPFPATFGSCRGSSPSPIYSCA